MKKSILGGLAVALALAVSFPAAAAVVGVTSAAALGATDTLDWAQLGPDFTIFNSSQNVVTAGGLGAVVSSDGNVFERRTQDASWGGNFAPGEALLWNKLAGPDFTLTFAAPVSGVGARIQADYYGAYEANVIGSDGSILGTFSASGNGTSAGDGSALFIGLKSDAADISSIRFTLNSATNAPNDFAIGQVSVADGLSAVSAAPEPSTWALMMLAIGMLGWVLRANVRANRDMESLQAAG
jgi:hypothetical protein